MSQCCIIKKSLAVESDNKGENTVKIMRIMGGTVMRNEIVNELATVLKEHGFESSVGRCAWGRLAEELTDLATAKARTYIRNNGTSTRLSEDSLISVALYEGIKYALTGWDITRGDFGSRYFHYLPKLFLTQHRNECGSDKTKAMSTAISVETPVHSEEDITIGDTLVDTKAVIEITPIYARVAELFGMYTKEVGQDKAELARIIVMYGDNLKLRNKKICELHGVDVYNAGLRKKVERVRKHFSEFCLENKEILVA